MTRGTISGSYYTLPVRMLLSLAMAIFIVLYQAPVGPVEALISTDFYISVAGSFVIAFILISCVHVSTLQLDKLVSWQDSPLQRITLQALIGFFLPCVIAILLAAAYFFCYGIRILETDYLRIDFPLIVVMIFILNLAYFQLSYGPQRKEHEHEHYLIIEENDDSDLLAASPTNGDISRSGERSDNSLIIHYNSRRIVLQPEKDVAFFICIGRNYFAKTMTGRNLPIDMTLKDAEVSFSGRDFIRINRKLIINRCIILSCHHASRANTFSIETLPEIATPEEISQEIFTVTERWAEPFLSWYDGELL